MIFEDRIPADRPEDAHDSIGTYRLVSDESEMTQVPSDAEDLVRLLKRRHGVL